MSGEAIALLLLLGASVGLASGIAAAGNLGIKAARPAFAKASHLVAQVMPRPRRSDAPHAAVAPVWLGRHHIAEGADHE